jgi:hypothetical protein
MKLLLYFGAKRILTDFWNIENQFIPIQHNKVVSAHFLVARTGNDAKMI